MAQTMRRAAAPAVQQSPVGSFFEIEAGRLADIRTRMAAVRLDPSVPAQAQPVRRLFEVLRAGGSYGLGYEAQRRREPRRPDEVLRTGRGDCDEFAFTFLAAARALGINAAMTLSRFTLSDSRSAIPHGALSLTIGGQRFVVDPSLGRFRAVGDFSDATMRTELAPSLGLAGGAARLTNRVDMSSVQDMAASAYFEMAQYRCPSGNAAVAPSRLDEALELLRLGVRSGAANPAAIAMGRDVALTLFKRYFDLAESAYLRRDYRTAERLYLRALEVHSLVPSVASNHRDAIYRANETLGRMFSSSRRYADAVSRYAEARRLRPDIRQGYDFALRALDVLASDPRNQQRLAHAQQGLALSAEAGRRFGTSPALKRAYERSERHFRWLVERMGRTGAGTPASP
ncbi:MAG: transglutaminase domain-containing protein [Candidatus Micrarchaeota archaeon]